MSKPPGLPPSGKRGLVALCYTLATMMQALDGTIAAVALPHIAANLVSTQDQVSWVLTSYIIATAIATPLTGWLAARWGTRNLFVGAVLGFTAASALCGLATTLAQLVVFRLLQGVCGAALVPLSQTVLLAVYPKERHGQAMAWWGMGAMVGPILGPMVGGWITDVAHWRFIFLINVPIGLFVAWGLRVGLQRDGRNEAPRFDAFGFVSLAVAVGMLQWVLDRGESMEWFDAREIRVAAACSAAAFVYFVTHTALSRAPTFFNCKLLLDRNYVSGLAFMFLIGVVLFATRALTAPMLQTVMGYSVSLSGWVTVPTGVGTMLAMLVAGRFIQRMHLGATMAAGVAMVAVSLFQMSVFSDHMTPAQIGTPGFLQGLGLGLISISLTTVAFLTLDPALRPDGASTLNLLRNLGSSLGISLMQTLLSRTTYATRDSLAAELAGHPVASLGGAERVTGVVSDQIDQISAMSGFTTDFRVMALVTVALMPLVLLLRVRR